MDDVIDVCVCVVLTPEKDCLYVSCSVLLITVNLFRNDLKSIYP